MKQIAGLPRGSNLEMRQGIVSAIHLFLSGREIDVCHKQHPAFSSVSFSVKG